MEMGVITLPNVIAFPNGKCCKHVYATPYERERERSYTNVPTIYPTWKPQVIFLLDLTS